MPRRLPSLAICWLLGVASAAEPPPPPTPQILLQTAIRTLEGRDSVTARLRYEVNLFDKRLVGAGSYAEQRPGRDNLLRMELKLQLGDESSSLVIVGDGRYLWQHRSLPSETTLTRVDLVRVVRAMDQPGAMPWRTNQPGLPGVGGLPKLLRGLDASFDFAKAEDGTWGKHKQRVWRLTGQWNRAELLRLLPKQKERIEKGEPPDLNKLPHYLPDAVVVLLGQEDRFPYRIEYHRTTVEPDDQRPGPMMGIDLYEVRLNVPLDRSQFIYNPGATQFSDQTDALMESLGIRK
jgi:hypothetical protein